MKYTITTARIAFSKSPKKVINPAFQPNTRKEFVAPAFPLPSFLISIPLIQIFDITDLSAVFRTTIADLHAFH